jgi:ABC-2 type transport system permease protein
MSAFLRDTAAELISRKIFVVFLVITALLLLMVYLSWGIREDLSVRSGGEFGAEELLGSLAPWIAEVFSRVMSVYMFFAVLAAAGLLPRMLEKGRAEFLLSHPVSRTQLLLGKLVSIWLIYGLMAIICGLVVYGVTAAVHGVFDVHIILLFAVYMLEFLIWVSVIGLTGILTGSAAWSMIAAFTIWLAQYLLSYHEGITQLASSRFVDYAVESLYFVIPKTGEVGDLAVRLAVGRPIHSWLPLWSSLLFALVVFYFAVWSFRRRDY